MFIEDPQGDPTVYGNLRAPENVSKKAAENTLSCEFNGYYPASGIPGASFVTTRTFLLIAIVRRTNGDC